MICLVLDALVSKFAAHSVLFSLALGLLMTLFLDCSLPNSISVVAIVAQPLPLYDLLTCPAMSSPSMVELKQTLAVVVFAH